MAIVSWFSGNVFKGALLVRSVPFDGLYQVRYQVVAALELHVNV
jgi:hypothetical protein